MKVFYRYLFILLLLAMAGCASADAATDASVTITPVVVESSAARPTDTGIIVTATSPVPAKVNLPPTADLPERPKPTLGPDAWSRMPVLPKLSPRAREILAEGITRGNNPRAFSKIGDCESQTDWFLDMYDLGPDHYSLGEYEALAPVIDYYKGSFGRTSLAARQGFTAASLMSPIWADPQQCEKGETPLACEYRLHKPAVAFILVGTNDAVNPPTFEKHMRKAIEFSIAQGVLPVLGTKADNVEGDHEINATLARLAHEYELPLWNYWLAVQDLPDQGLQEDGAHLTFAAPFFDRPDALRRAWPVRNLNALQVLDTLMEASEQP